MASLTVLIGPPGCGKSTWSRQFGRGTVLSSDSVREELFGDIDAHEGDAETAAELDRRIFTAIAAHEHVMVENGANLRRGEYLDAARAAGMPAHAVIFDNPDEARRHNAERDPDGPHPPVPQKDFARALAEAASAAVAVPHEAWDTVQRIVSYRL